MHAQRQAETVPAAVAAATVNPARPVVTWYDDSTGERIELSGTTLGNWSAKTANLLTDGAGLAPGDRVLVDAPPHWQSAAVLLACWQAGMVVVVPPAKDRVDAVSAVEVVFAAADRLDRYAGTGTPEVYGLSLAPMAAPMREVPPGVTDFIREVRTHGDHFTPIRPVAPTDPALLAAAPAGGQPAPGAVSHAELCADAAGRAEALGLAPGDRALIDAATCPDFRDWLLAPLLRAGSIVLCGALDPAAIPGRITAERVTAVLTGDGT